VTPISRARSATSTVFVVSAIFRLMPLVPLPLLDPFSIRPRSTSSRPFVRHLFPLTVYLLSYVGPTRPVFSRPIVLYFQPLLSSWAYPRKYCPPSLLSFMMIRPFSKLVFFLIKSVGSRCLLLPKTNPQDAYSFEP